MKVWKLEPQKKQRPLNEAERTVFNATIESITNGNWDVASLYAKSSCGTCRGKGWYGFDIVLPAGLTLQRDGKDIRATPEEKRVCSCVEKRLEREILDESEPDSKKRNMARA
jgi:hypothetical protein